MLIDRSPTWKTSLPCLAGGSKSWLRSPSVNRVGAGGGPLRRSGGSARWTIGHADGLRLSFGSELQHGETLCAEAEGAFVVRRHGIADSASAVQSEAHRARPPRGRERAAGER